jgi:hypothetical protein
MRRFSVFLGTTFLFLCFALSANAALITASGPNSSLGTAPAVILAPLNALDNVVTNTGMEGFDEAQGVTVPVGGLNVDAGTIPASTNVNSHMIFFNIADTSGAVETHLNVQWTFDTVILGVMSDTGGTLEASSNALLGAPGPPATNYPGAFNFRGMEPGEPNPDDYSFVAGSNVLTASMYVSQPGDWIRVVTDADQVIPEPATMLLVGSGLLGMAIAGRRKFFKKS